MKRAIIISALIAALASPVGAYAAIVPAYDGNVLTLDLKTGLQAGSNAVISVLQKGAEQIVQNAYAMEEATHKLIEIAKEKGGGDNITIAAISDY